MRKKLSNIKELKKLKKPLVIEFQGKEYKINLMEELSITEGIINSQLKGQPSSYYFLCSLKNQAIANRDSLESKKDVEYSKAFVLAKESNPSINNDLADHKARKNKNYILANEEYINAKKEASDLMDACRAFEQRGNLIQTISSNLRKEL